MATITQAELWTALQAHGYAPDSQDAQTVALNQSIRDIRNWREWYWNTNISEGSIVLPQGGDTLSGTSSLFVSPDAVRLDWGNVEFFNPEYMDPFELFDKRNAQRDPGFPQFWTYWGQGIYIWPKADRTYNASLQYDQEYQELAAGDGASTTQQMPRSMIPTIVWGALKYLAYRQRDWDAFNIAERQFNNSIQKAAARQGMNQRGNTSRSGQSGFYDTYDMVSGFWGT